MAKEYIERDAICYQLEKQESIDGQPRAIRRARRIVAEFPAADVAPVRHGRWIVDDITGLVKCSICKNDAPLDTTGGGQWHSPICPTCGAKMDLKDSDGE